MIVVSLFLAVSACSHRGALAGYLGDASAFPGYVDIELRSFRNATDDPIAVTFLYGHDYPSSYDTANLLGHTIEVYLTEDLGGALEPDDRIVLYESSFTDADFLTEENRCDPGGWIFARVRYARSFALDIDFADLDFTVGLLVIRIAETRIYEESVGDEIRERVGTVYRSASFFFRVEDDVVLFSTRRVE